MQPTEEMEMDHYDPETVCADDCDLCYEAWDQRQADRMETFMTGGGSER